MKKTILTLCILVTALGFAWGQSQPLTAATFASDIDGLNTNYNQGNLSRINVSMDQLDGMMSNQITYMSNMISGLQGKYAADSTTAVAAKRAAAAELANAQTEKVKANSLTKANTDNAKATGDVKQASALQTAVDREKSNIATQQAKLATEQQIYKQIQQLKGNMIANRVAINAGLKAFENTL
jgi:hypothetical protein